ncbi:MAG: ABC transporter ATP-binding protein [Lachnospiraceae bacterium]|jgi:putative ABC transport system ATP-binding protein|nr:ABC transporter ATP-binding protein [Lachnospiraceae bacterium]MCR5116644.1 ABC transporter ATP-binding protein [Lachnospiraceae bacterium]
MSNLVIDAEKITRVFPVPGGEFTALKGVDAKVEAGTFCILRGRSGSGKTTLMNIIGTLDDPTSGTVSIGGKPIKGMSTYDREELRRKELGFVFQSVSLIPSLNAFQNVEFSMRMAGIKPSKERDKRVEDCLRMVGLANRMNHMPAEMSGGEQQRVAIARSIAHSPKLILADEPTAELDSQMAAKVTEIFKEMTRKEGITVLMTTHDVGLMGAADEIIELENGERING